MHIRHVAGACLLPAVFMLSACSGTGTQTVATSFWSSTDAAETVEPDTLDFAEVLIQHGDLPVATRTALREEAEEAAARWRKFEHAAADRSDRTYRTWFYSRQPDWTVDYQGVGLGNALHDLHRATTIDPSFGEAWAGLGHLSLAVGDLEAGRQALEHALLLARADRRNGNPLPREVELGIHRDLSWALRDLALWNEGLAAADSGLAFAPGDQELELVRGLLLAGAGRTVEAMTAAAHLAPMRYPLYNFTYFGMRYQESAYANNWIRAIAHLQLGDAAMARQLLGVLDHYSYRGHLPHTERFWRDAGLIAELASDEQAPLWYAMGYVNRHYRRFIPVMAENTASQVLDLPHPRMPVFTCLGGRFYVGGSPLTYAAAQINRMAMAWSDVENREASQRALGMLDILCRRGIAPGYSHALRGRIHYANGDYTTAATELSTAHGIMAQEQWIDPVTSLMLGVLALQNERYAEAEIFLAESLSADPDQPSAWRSLGIARAQQGRIVPARRAMDHAVEMDPRNVAGYYNRGLFHLQHKDFTAATEDLLDAYLLDPDNHEVQRLLEMAAAGAGSSPATLTTYGNTVPNRIPAAQDELAGREAELDALFALPDSLRTDSATTTARILELEKAYAVDGDPGIRKVLALAYLDHGQYPRVQLLLGPEWGGGLLPEEEIILLYADRQVGEQERADALVASLLAGEAGIGNPYLWTFLALEMRTDNVHGNLSALSEVNKRYLKYSAGTKAKSYGFPPLDKLTEWMKDGFNSAREYKIKHGFPLDPQVPLWYREVSAAARDGTAK